VSDSESSISDSESSHSTYSEDVKEGFQAADFKAFAEGLNQQVVTDISNVSLETFPGQIGYAITSGGALDPVKPPPKSSDPPLFESTSQTITSVVMIESIDRDIVAFPQPTNLTLRLPRIYKNVTGFSIIQIKLLSAFYYFRAAKENISISILELARTNPDASGNPIANIITNTIRQGTYDINGLINELTVQLNNTPIFYDFINGFQDFAQKFAVTGDFSLNFNFPGDTYFDSLLNQYISNPTMTTIISKYFLQRYGNLPSYTNDQIKVAYYYPVLKETVLHDTYESRMNYNIVTSVQYLLDTETPYSRIVYTFQGIDDPVILELINLNVVLLTDYRLKHTFRYSLINKYIISYQQQSNQISISAPSLNTSLVNLLNYKRAQFLAEQISYYGLTQAEYDNLNSQTANLLAVLNDMVNYYQTYLAVYFGIPYNTYSFNYLLESNNILPLRDAYNAIGISSNYSATVENTPITNNLLDVFRTDPKPYWNRMSNLPSTTVAYMNPVLPGESGTAGINYYTWNLDMDEQDTRNPIVLSNVIDSNNPNTTPIGNLYINRRTVTSEVIIPTESSKYTVFRFKSPVRQTLRVETLPRPTKYRYPAYNAIAYDLSNQEVFDASYSFINPSMYVDVENDSFDSSKILYIPGFSNASSVTPFGNNYQTSLSYWGSNYVTISVIDPRVFYSFYTPYPPNYTSIGAPAYTYPFRLSFANPNEGQGFVTPMNCFIYQDRSAYMADISGNGNENPLHYSYYVSTVAGLSSVNLDFKAYANKRYYILIRPIPTSFGTDSLRIVPWFPSSTFYTALTSTLVGFDPLADPTSNLNNYNYAQVADPDFLHVPTSSNLYAPPVLDETFSPLRFNQVLMGYDVSGVSTDLTNYIGFLSNTVGSNSVPNASFRTDPTNGFIFQYKTPYDTNTQLYISSGVLNTILYPQAAAVYSNSTIPYRQKSIVNWYGNVFIPPSQNQAIFPTDAIAFPGIAPYTDTFPIQTGVAGYNYNTRKDISGNTYLNTSNLIDLGDGVVGIGFLPEEGVWDIDKFMFKSIFTSSSSNIDPNLETKFIGIFPAVITSNRAIQSLALSNALAVLSFGSSITYNSSNQNLGFDIVGGTYYEFTRNTSYITGSNSYLYGYTQAAYEYNFDLNMYYLAIPFTASSNLNYYYGLVGSAIPYPLYNTAVSVDSVPSPEGPVSTPLGVDFIIPGTQIPGANTIFGPPTGFTPTESKYEQSMTSVTNLIVSVNPYAINTVDGVYKPAQSFTYEPTQIIGDCSGFIMTHDSVFRVYSYLNSTSNIDLNEVQQFTLDEVFPQSSNIQYLGVSANESNYAFFGLSNAVPNPYIYIRTLNPVSGFLENSHSEISPLAFQSSVQLFKATYNNLGGYTLSAQAYDNVTSTSFVQVVSKPTRYTSTFTTLTYTPTQTNITNFIVQQSPKEEFGRFWVFPYRSGINGFNNFLFVNPNNLSTVSSSPDYNAYTYPYYGASNQDVKYASINNYTLPNTYYSPIVTRDVALDRVYFLSVAGPTKFYEATTNTFTPTVKESVYTFPSTPTQIVPGANGSQWANIYKTIYGNRGNLTDAPKTGSQVWQIFNPVQRIVFHQIAKNFSFLLDLSGRKYPEYPHTTVAVYDSSGAFTNDTNAKWGLESSENFITGDFNTSGYYFNAYDYIVPLYDNRSTDDYYYMSIRNYFPTEKSQVTLRISAPNKYTFGYVTPIDLSGEISTAQSVVSTYSLNSRYWDTNYTRSILEFNSKFTFGSNGVIFGGGIVPGFAGSNITNVNGFGDFYSRMKATFSTYSSLLILGSTINSQAKLKLNEFVLSDLKYIIPVSAQNRQRVTDPLRYSIRWKSALSSAYSKLENNWGLGWNLGFAKEDTPFATVQFAPSFFKLIDDYIQLRMNPEFDLNRMDSVQKENLALSLETTGITKAYYGKLLLSNFGSYAQTLISNPIAFLNPVGKLDKLSFQWLDITNAIINNNDCEWNAVVQITEKITIATPKVDTGFNQTLYN